MQFTLPGNLQSKHTTDTTVLVYSHNGAGPVHQVKCSNLQDWNNQEWFCDCEQNKN